MIENHEHANERASVVEKPRYSYTCTLNGWRDGSITNARADDDRARCGENRLLFLGGVGLARLGCFGGSTELRSAGSTGSASHQRAS